MVCTLLVLLLVNHSFHLAVEAAHACFLRTLMVFMLCRIEFIVGS